MRSLLVKTALHMAYTLSRFPICLHCQKAMECFRGLAPSPTSIWWLFKTSFFKEPRDCLLNLVKQLQQTKYQISFNLKWRNKIQQHPFCTTHTVAMCTFSQQISFAESSHIQLKPRHAVIISNSETSQWIQNLFRFGGADAQGVGSYW